MKRGRRSIICALFIPAVLSLSSCDTYQTVKNGVGNGVSKMGSGIKGVGSGLTGGVGKVGSGMRSVSQKVTKPVGSVGEKSVGGLKKMNPMKLIGRKKDKDAGDLAEAANGAEEIGATTDTLPNKPSLNTRTPGSQLYNNSGRSTLSLPSRPYYEPPATPAQFPTTTRPQPSQIAITPPVSSPPPRSIPAPTPRLEPEPEPVLAPLPPPSEAPPIFRTTPPAPTQPGIPDEDGFLPLAPKLPEEESILPPS